MEEKSYKEHLKHINTFIFDVDGVLTDGSISVTTNGDMLRTMSIKDGYALKTAADAGFNVCIISEDERRRSYSINRFGHYRYLPRCA